MRTCCSRLLAYNYRARIQGDSNNRNAAEVKNLSLCLIWEGLQREADLFTITQYDQWSWVHAANLWSFFITFWIIRANYPSFVPSLWSLCFILFSLYQSSETCSFHHHDRLIRASQQRSLPHTETQKKKEWKDVLFFKILLCGPFFHLYSCYLLTNCSMFSPG